MEKNNWLKGVVIVCLAAVLALPIYTFFFLEPAFITFISDSTESDAEQIASHLASMLLSDKQQLSKESLTGQFLQQEKRILKDFNVYNIKIFRSDGEVIYSENEDEIGIINTKDYFINQVAAGNKFTKIVKKDGLTVEGQPVSSDVVETYVPIMKNGTFMGAFELYFDITDRMAILDRMMFRLNTILLGIVLLLLISVTASAGKALMSSKRSFQAEESIEKSEAMFGELFESMSNAAAILKGVNNGNDFIIENYNRAAEHVEKVSQKEVLGKSVKEVFPNINKYGLFDVFKRVWETGKSEFHPVTIFKDDKIEGWRENFVYKLTSGEIVIIYDDLTKRKQIGHDMRVGLDRLRKTLSGIIQAMASAVETRDPSTAGHQKRVAELARKIAQEMGLENDVVEAVRMAGQIHDVGQLAVPSEILSKPSRVSDIEYSLIKEHPKAGHSILEGLEFECEMAKIILQHHERLDGSGYPNGLTGEDILIEAKVLAVADVVEALCSHRPYRSAQGIEKALNEIKENRGKLYDPDVVDACVRIFENEGFELS